MTIGDEPAQLVRATEIMTTQPLVVITTDREVLLVALADYRMAMGLEKNQAEPTMETTTIVVEPNAWDDPASCALCGGPFTPQKTAAYIYVEPSDDDLHGQPMAAPVCPTCARSPQDALYARIDAQIERLSGNIAWLREIRATAFVFPAADALAPLAAADPGDDRPAGALDSIFR